MGCCCGESIDKPTDQEKNANKVNGHGVLTKQQPSPHPGAQIAQMQDKMFQQPTIPSPPPVQQFNMQTTGGYQQPQWVQQPAQSPPPNMNQFNPYAQATSTSPVHMSNQFTGTTLNGMGPNSSMTSTLNGSLQRPNPVHPGSPFQVANNPMMASSMSPQQRMGAVPMEFNSPPIDEGKMSVSIDFGE